MISRQRLIEIVENFKNGPSILVVGDVGVDKYTYGVVERISPEAPVPILEVSKEWFKLGLAANVSDNLSGLKVKSTLCGVIGEDFYGNLFEELLEEEGLKTWGILRVANRATTLKERVITQTQQICRIDYENRNKLDDDTEQRILSRKEELAHDHQALILQDYGKGLLSEKMCQSFIKKFKEQAKLVVVDPSRQNHPEYYRGADIIKPNLKEAQIIAEHFGVKDLNDRNELIQTISKKLDIAKVLMTLGKDGMAIYDREHGASVEIIPTVATEVFDVSGAGDTVVSVVVSCLLGGCTLKEAAFVSNIAAGVVVGKKGTARVSAEEIISLFDKAYR